MENKTPSNEKENLHNFHDIIKEEINKEIDKLILEKLINSFNYYEYLKTKLDTFERNQLF